MFENKHFIYNLTTFSLWEFIRFPVFRLMDLSLENLMDVLLMHVQSVVRASYFWRINPKCKIHHTFLFLN
jgi:hypothetical protein